MDGKWLQCSGDLKRHSMGKTFAGNFIEIMHGQYCIDHHLNPIDDPATAHHATFRVILETTRRACLINAETNFVISNEIYKGKPVESFAKQWMTHQQDHYKNDISKVVEFLNLLHIYQHSPYASSYIAQAWKRISLEQKIVGMDELASMIIKNPSMTPSILIYIQTLLILQGNNAYRFPFNEKQEPLRPFVAIPAGRFTNYLTLPGKHGSPVQLGHAFIDSFHDLASCAKQFEKTFGYKNLEFFSGIFKHLNLNPKYIGEEYLHHIEKDFTTFFQSPKTKEMQSWFGQYPTPESVILRMNASQIKAKTVTPLEKKEELTEELAKKVAGIQRQTPEAIIDQKEEAAKAQMKHYENLAEEIPTRPLYEVFILLNKLFEFKASNHEEIDNKEVLESFRSLRVVTKEILADGEVKKRFGPAFCHHLFGQILPVLYEKHLKYANVELFEAALDIYHIMSSENFLSQKQEEKMAAMLFNAFKSLAPKISTPLHIKGCNLICHCYKKQLFKEKEILLKSYETLIASRNTEHLRMAFTKLNEVLIHIKHPEVVQIMKTLLANSILNGTLELARPMYKALVKLYKRDRISFDRLMDSPGIHRGPAIANGVKALIPTLKFHGDELLLLMTLLCVLNSRPHHTLVKSSLTAFMALIKQQAAVAAKNEIPISLKTKECTGLILREFLKYGVPLQQPVHREWIENIIKSLISVQNSHLDFQNKPNRFQELGFELASQLIYLSNNPQWQEKLQKLLPKITWVKKIEEKEGSSAEKIEKAVLTLTNLSLNPSRRGIKNKTLESGQQILSILKEAQQNEFETLSKKLYGKLINEISQTQFLLSNAKGSGAIKLAQKIHNIAKEKGLIHSEELEDITVWIIQGYLNNKSASFNLKLHARLMPLINTLMTNVEKGKRLKEHSIHIIIEALGRLSKDFPEENKLITKHLVTLCRRKPENEKTQSILIEYIYLAINDFAKSSDHVSYELALNLFKALLEEIPVGDQFKLIYQALDAMTKNLPKNWRTPSHFKQWQDLIQVLKKSLLSKFDERMQFALIATAHQVQPNEREYIWELIQHISGGGITPKAYEILLNYLNFIQNNKELVISAATLFNTHFKNAEKNCETSDLKDRAKRLLVALYLQTGHEAYIKKAFETCLTFKELSSEIINKIMSYYANGPLETMSDEIICFTYKLPNNNFNIDDLELRFGSSLQTDLMLEQYYLIVDRMLTGSTLYRQTFGFSCLLRIFKLSEIFQKKIKEKIIVGYLKVGCNELIKKRDVEGIFELLDLAWPLLNKESRSDLYEYLETVLKKLGDQYLKDIHLGDRSMLPKKIDDTLNFYLTILTGYFPEYARKFHLCYLNTILKKDPEYAISFSNLTKRLYSLGLYKIVTKAPFEVRQATDAEQLEINRERQSFLSVGFNTLMALVTINPKKAVFIHDQLFSINNWISFSSLKDIEKTVGLHRMYATYLMNKTLLSLDGNEYLNYFAELLQLVKKSFELARKVVKDPASTPQQIEESLEIANRLLIFLENQNCHLVQLSLLYKCADAAAGKLNYEKSKRLEFLKKLVQTHTPAHVQTVLMITKVLEKLYSQLSMDPSSSENNFDYSTKVLIFGILMITTEKQYEIAMSNEARVLASKLSLEFLKHCLALRKEFNELRPLSGDIGNSLAQFTLIFWNQHFADINLTGAARKDYLAACLELSTKYKPEKPIDALSLMAHEQKAKAKRKVKRKGKAKAKKDNFGKKVPQ